MVTGDNHRFRGMRKRLVEEIRNKGIKDASILEAIGKIPRHLFLDNAFAEWAYKDVAFSIDAEQTISQPYTVAFQTELLDIKNGEKVMEIGTGSGYQAAVLAELGSKVYSIERHEILFKKSTLLLKKLGYYSVLTFHGDGYLGLSRHAPFDKILITAAAPEIPGTLIDQLKIGGYLVVPYGAGETQKMLRILKCEKGRLEKETFGNFRFVPMLKGIGKKT